MINMDGCKSTGVVLLLLGLALAAGCGRTGTDPLTTAYFEERWLGMGHANETYRYAESLYRQGRYREAMAAYNAVEKAAYSQELRRAARQRRYYLQEYIAAQEKGRTPAQPPYFSAPVKGKPKPPAASRAKPGSPYGSGSRAGTLQPLPLPSSPYGSGSQAGTLQPLPPAPEPAGQTRLLPPSPPIVEQPAR